MLQTLHYDLFFSSFGRSGYKSQAALQREWPVEWAESDLYPLGPGASSLL